MNRIILLMALWLSLSAAPMGIARADDLPPGEDATVSRVIDGDTIQVAIGDRRFTVRYIGIDAPESAVPGTAVQCFAREATSFNRALVQGQRVRLERDVNDVDRFNRLLRYVYLSDGRMVNEELARAGYAVAATYPPDVKHQERLGAAQQAAVADELGLWAACPAAPAAAAQPTPAAPAAGLAAQPGASCDPSYPTLCIPVGAADLDCPDIPQRRFEVRAPDPHRFDGDKDGIGCEK